MREAKSSPNMSATTIVPTKTAISNMVEKAMSVATMVRPRATGRVMGRAMDRATDRVMGKATDRDTDRATDRVMGRATDMIMMRMMPKVKRTAGVF